MHIRNGDKRNILCIVLWNLCGRSLAADHVSNITYSPDLPPLGNLAQFGVLEGIGKEVGDLFGQGGGV